MCERKKRPYKNLVGLRFGRLFVESLVEDEASSSVPTRYKCLCDCGNRVVVRGYNLKSGGTKSCGCLQKEVAANRFIVHGDTGSRLYVCWQHMIRRCEKESDHAFLNYGGRGISVCEEWHKYESFKLWAESSGYADDLTLDRINVNGNYEPDNCRWLTLKEQQKNKRTNTYLEFNGEVKTIGEWAREFHCLPGSVYRIILEKEGRVFRCD